MAQLKAIHLHDSDVEKYICQICGNIMKTPIQTFRGNAACYNCYFTKEFYEIQVCPIDKEPISPKQVFPDKAKGREINNLQCYCPNRESGCTWTGKVSQLKDHSCDFESIYCSHCDTKVFVNEEENHIKECPEIVKAGSCFFKKYGCKYEATNEEEMAIHLQMNTQKHQFFQSQQSQIMEQKYREVSEENMRLRATVNTLERRFEESEQQKNVEIAAMYKEIEEMKEMLRLSRGLNESSNPSPKLDNKVNNVINIVNKNTSDISDLDLRFQLHENSVHDGRLVWKIDDFKRRRNEAVIGKITALHSSPCFTSQYGYKFCLRIYLNGDGMGRGSHISLFLVIMKSEYDNILQWPFTKKVKFSLINQNNRNDNIVERMVPNRESSSFQKPRKEMNIASGIPLFVEIDRLEREGFVKDDALFIDCEIS